MNRRHNPIRLWRQKAEQFMLAVDRRALGPRTPRQGVHRPAKAKSGLSSARANHIGVLCGFVSLYSQNDVACTLQRLPLPSHLRQCGALHVPDVGHRLAAKLRRARHAPTGHDKFALAVRADADDRRHLIREDCRQWRKVAGAIVLDREEITNGRLALGDTVEVAHAGDYVALRREGKALKRIDNADEFIGEDRRRAACRAFGAGRIRGNEASQMIGGALEPGFNNSQPSTDGLAASR